MLLTLKSQEEAMSQGMEEPQEAEKVREHSLLDPLVRMQPPHCKIINLCFLRHSICGDLLCQQQETNIPMEV